VQYGRHWPLAANGRHYVAYEAPCVSIKVDARNGNDAGRAITGNELDIFILEEMVVTLDIKLEPQPAAKYPAGPPGLPAEFGVAPEIDAQVWRDYPLRLCGRGRGDNGQHGENNAASNAHHERCSWCGSNADATDVCDETCDTGDEEQRLSPAGDATSKDQDTEAFAVYVGPNAIFLGRGRHAEVRPPTTRT
jgi:hypothetical protein